MSVSARDVRICLVGLGVFHSACAVVPTDVSRNIYKVKSTHPDVLVTGMATYMKNEKHKNRTRKSSTTGKVCVVRPLVPLYPMKVEGIQQVQYVAADNINDVAPPSTGARNVASSIAPIQGGSLPTLCGRVPGRGSHPLPSTRTAAAAPPAPRSPPPAHSTAGGSGGVRSSPLEGRASHRRRGESESFRGRAKPTTPPAADDGGNQDLLVAAAPTKSTSCCRKVRRVAVATVAILLLLFGSFLAAVEFLALDSWQDSGYLSKAFYPDVFQSQKTYVVGSFFIIAFFVYNVCWSCRGDDEEFQAGVVVAVVGQNENGRVSRRSSNGVEVIMDNSETRTYEKSLIKIRDRSVDLVLKKGQKNASVDVVVRGSLHLPKDKDDSQFGFSLDEYVLKGYEKEQSHLCQSDPDGHPVTIAGRQFGFKNPAEGDEAAYKLIDVEPRARNVTALRTIFCLSFPLARLRKRFSGCWPCLGESQNPYLKVLLVFWDMFVILALIIMFYSFGQSWEAQADQKVSTWKALLKGASAKKRTSVEGKIKTQLISAGASSDSAQSWEDSVELTDTAEHREVSNTAQILIKTEILDPAGSVLGDVKTGETPVVMVLAWLFLISYFSGAILKWEEVGGAQQDMNAPRFGVFLVVVLGAMGKFVRFLITLFLPAVLGSMGIGVNEEQSDDLIFGWVVGEYCLMFAIYCLNIWLSWYGCDFLVETPGQAFGHTKALTYDILVKCLIALLVKLGFMFGFSNANGNSCLNKANIGRMLKSMTKCGLAVVLLFSHTVLDIKQQNLSANTAEYTALWRDAIQNDTCDSKLGFEWFQSLVFFFAKSNCCGDNKQWGRDRKNIDLDSAALGARFSAGLDELVNVSVVVPGLLSLGSEGAQKGAWMLIAQCDQMRQAIDIAETNPEQILI